MGLTAARNAMTRLENSANAFDYDNAARYASYVRQFTQRRSAATSSSSILPNLSHVNELPVDLNVRVEAWMQSHPDYSPFMRRFAVNYLLAFLDDKCDATVYEPLVDLVRAGGDFFVENDIFFLRDAIAVPGHRH